MSKRKAVGIHVFAGGFTQGVQEVFDVKHQLEVHGFGLETAAAICDIEPINCPAAEWPDIEAEFAFGNPRCTGFSNITGGYGEDKHGPWAEQTCDIHEFCNYVASRYDIAIWESVQEASTTGRPLLDYLRDEVFAPKGYRVAHVFINAASFGNAQQRKRYFFVAYRGDKSFNVVPPDIDDTYSTVYHHIYDVRDRETRAYDYRDSDYDRDSYSNLSPDQWATLPYLPNGWGLNTLGKYFVEALPPRYQEKWHCRTSDMPFSMHNIHRLNWLRPMPTIYSKSNVCIHPDLDRPLTVGELSTLMGWRDIPRGPNPTAQLGKGVVPAVGRWLAWQAQLYLDDAWGGEDWESSYDAKTGEWVGRDTHGELEKTFDLTRYVGLNLKEHDLDVIHHRELHDLKRNWELVHGELLPEPRWWDKRSRGLLRKPGLPR